MCVSISCLHALALCNTIFLVSALGRTTVTPDGNATDIGWLVGRQAVAGKRRLAALFKGSMSCARGVPAESRQRRFVLSRFRPDSKLNGKTVEAG